MIVSMILDTKGRNVVTIGAEATIREAVDELASRKIGAIVVVEGIDRIVGIISERDVVRAVAKRGTEVLSESVGSIMTREVMTCSDSETINEVMSRSRRGSRKSSARPRRCAPISRRRDRRDRSVSRLFVTSLTKSPWPDSCDHFRWKRRVGSPAVGRFRRSAIASHAVTALS
jgi:CBS domain-containing protein